MMREQRRPIPGPSEVLVALDAVIDLQLDAFAEEDKFARAAPVLTLECVGGPEVPAAPDERDARLQALRGLLQKQVGRFASLPREELAKLTFPRSEPAGDERFKREVERLEDAATTMFQLNLPKPDSSKGKGDLQTAAKGAHLN